MLNSISKQVPSWNQFVSDSRSFGLMAWVHLRTHWLTYLALWLLWVVTTANYRIGINETVSLPQSVFWIHKNEQPTKGDYVAFEVPTEAKKHFKDPKAILAKIVVGVEGDRVTVKDRLVSVNGTVVGLAKEKSLKGEPLEPIKEQIVGAGQLYVMGLHKDSLDSRYSMVGLVSKSSVVGKAFPLW